MDKLTNEQLIELKNLSIEYNRNGDNCLFVCLDQEKAEFPYPFFKTSTGYLQGAKTQSPYNTFDVSFNEFKLAMLKFKQKQHGKQ